MSAFAALGISQFESGRTRIHISLSGINMLPAMLIVRRHNTKAPLIAGHIDAQRTL